ncbi:hypothetical protein K461DRAFT_60284 [Myriangium duriaei CBS 260.36]|uniref:Uncharacterized protein n=1 Tax=Myriangium duriaei CBS 260.36 TaxID=1168546 RepID=A0A9P4IUW1_9PEZI|nr:hypothetical protein K461DRAFT_60284 [Myriangium duriaei CBS 260.36]
MSVPGCASYSLPCFASCACLAYGLPDALNCLILTRANRFASTTVRFASKPWCTCDCRPSFLILATFPFPFLLPSLRPPRPSIPYQPRATTARQWASSQSLSQRGCVTCRIPTCPADVAHRVCEINPGGPNTNSASKGTRPHAKNTSAPAGPQAQRPAAPPKNPQTLRPRSGLVQQPNPPQHLPIHPPFSRSNKKVWNSFLLLSIPQPLSHISTLNSFLLNTRRVERF